MSETSAGVVPAQRVRSRATRWLHFLLAVAIVHQMVMSAIMQIPNPKRGHPGNVWWEFHEYGGLTAFAVVLAFWLWTIARGARETGFGDWFPWFSAPRRSALWRDIGDHLRGATRLRLPPPDATTPLASAVQGVGLTLVTIMATTGVLFWLGRQIGGAWPARSHWLIEVHGALGNIVWYYLAVHVGATLAHEFLGHRLLKPMSPLR